MSYNENNFWQSLDDAAIVLLTDRILVYLQTLFYFRSELIRNKESITVMTQYDEENGFVR